LSSVLPPSSVLSFLLKITFRFLNSDAAWLLLIDIANVADVIRGAILSIISPRNEIKEAITGSKRRLFCRDYKSSDSSFSSPVNNLHGDREYVYYSHNYVKAWELCKGSADIVPPALQSMLSRSVVTG
jgi:hypothetical protein